MIEKIRCDIIRCGFSRPDPKSPQGTLGFSEKIQDTDKEQKQTAPEPEKNK